MSKKEEKWLKRQAEKERAESGARRKAIPELTHAIEELVSRRKKPEELEGIIAEAKTLAQQWKDPHSAKHPKDRRPLFDGTTADRTFLLAGLVVALMRDHTFLEPIRRRFPNELEKLSREALFADLTPYVSDWASKQPKPTSKQAYEQKRRRWRQGAVGLIEKEFGNERLAAWRRAPDWVTFAPLLAPPEPTCLDDIFADRPVNMQKLEELFRIERHQLAKLVGDEDKKRRKYDYRVVVKIMAALLAPEKRPKKRKRLTPGRPGRLPWLNASDLRSRVLSEIEARINSLSVQEHIKASFLQVVDRYRPDSGKK